MTAKPTIKAFGSFLRVARNTPGVGPATVPEPGPLGRPRWCEGDFATGIAFLNATLIACDLRSFSGHMMGERYWSRDLHWIAFNKKIWTKRQARRVCVKKEQ